MVINRANNLIKNSRTLIMKPVLMPIMLTKTDMGCISKLEAQFLRNVWEFPNCETSPDSWYANPFALQSWKPKMFFFFCLLANWMWNGCNFFCKDVAARIVILKNNPKTNDSQVLEWFFSFRLEEENPIHLLKPLPSPQGIMTPVPPSWVALGTGEKVGSYTYQGRHGDIWYSQHHHFWYM